jgi:hypothetical protein
MPDAWVIALLVWIVVIPTMVALLAALAARRRGAERPDRSESEADQTGQLLYLASHERYGAVSRSNSSGSGRRPAPGPRLRLERTR